MRFGVNTFLWTKTFSAADLGLIEHVQSLGADGIEFARYGFDGFPVEAIRTELDRLGMGCTLCTAPYEPELSVIHPSAEARRHGLAYLREAVGVASRLGATALTGPLYAKVDWFTGVRRTEAEWNWAVEAFKALAPDIQRTALTVAIEPMNRWEAFFLNTAADGVTLCEAVGNPRVGLLLDTVHMAIEEKSQDGAIAAAGPWLRHMHVAETDRGTPGTGQTDWAGVFAALHGARFAGWCTIESFAWYDPAIAGPTHCWRDLAASPDALCRDGLAFLRKGAALAPSGTGPPRRRTLGDVPA